MKLGWWNKKVKFWSTDYKLVIWTGVFSVGVAVLVSVLDMLEGFPLPRWVLPWGLYIGILATIWSVRSALVTLDKKPETILVGKLLLSAVSCLLLMVLLSLIK